MKNAILLFMALLPCIGHSNLAVEEIEKTSIPISIDIDTPDDTPQRTLTPICYYSDGIVYIECNENVTSICGNVCRLKDNAQWTNSCRDNLLQISVSTDIGFYHLSFTLSNGTSYHGDYVISLNN